MKAVACLCGARRQVPAAIPPALWERSYRPRFLNHRGEYRRSHKPLLTRPVREKAREQVFSQLEMWREFKRQRPDFTIGAGVFPET
ncbi:MAG: hypothetical protein KGJ08_09315 [Gammaproteobacteria bacterium]|nr:hypothetical protein [Gammaproteobacteria bacterium]